MVLGDSRFVAHYERVKTSADPAVEIRRLGDEAVVAALAAASRMHDPFLANVLATEAQNRMRRTQATLEHLGEGVLTVDLEERVTFLNPAARRMLGAEHEPLVGAPLHDVVPGAAHEPRCTVSDAMRTRRPQRCDTESFTRRDGRAFPAAYTVAPLLRDDEVEGAVIVFRDITQRRRAEADLRESEERWRCLAEAAFEGIAVHDGERVLDVNAAFARIFRVSPEVATRMRVEDFLTPEARAVAAERRLHPSDEAVEMTVLRADGTTFLAELRGRAITYQGRPARVVAVRPKE